MRSMTPENTVGLPTAGEGPGALAPGLCSPDGERPSAAGQAHRQRENGHADGGEHGLERLESQPEQLRALEDDDPGTRDDRELPGERRPLRLPDPGPDEAATDEDGEQQAGHAV